MTLYIKLKGKNMFFSKQTYNSLHYSKKNVSLGLIQFRNKNLLGIHDLAPNLNKALCIYNF